MESTGIEMRQEETRNYILVGKFAKGVWGREDRSVAQIISIRSVASVDMRYLTTRSKELSLGIYEPVEDMATN